jgi:hypothetical protein
MGDGRRPGEVWRCAKDGNARPASPREGDEGGARTSAGEKRGRPGGPAEGHWACWPVGRRWEEGRWAAAGSKIGDGPKLKKKFLSNFN